jgi:hypothetical protein
VVAIANQTAANCRFSFAGWDRIYTAVCSGIVVQSENDIVVFSGQHESGMSNANVQQITFTNSQMETIPSNVFDTFRGLTTLTAQNAGINRLSVGTLRNCQNLLNLDLSFNSISRLDNHVFRSCSSLSRVTINNNQLTTLGAHTFALPTLRTIELRNNSIVSLPEGIFSNAGGLDMISLSFNRIQRITRSLFQGNTEIPERAFFDLRLSNLGLDRNLISTIGNAAFGGVGMLSTRAGGLQLQNNRFTRLSSAMFGGHFSNLASIDIRNNGITAIERDFFTFLEQELSVSATGNSCVNRDFLTSNRGAVNTGMVACFANF